MNTYNIEMKYIKNEESFVFSVLACILKEISEEINNIDRERKIQALSKVSKSYLLILKFQKIPNEILNSSYDALELTSTSMSIINLQENVYNLIYLFSNPITINIVGGFPEYKDEILADFGRFIIFKEII